MGNMNNIGNVEEKKKKNHVALIIILIGVVVLIVGIVLMNLMGIDRYENLNDYNDTFDGSAVTRLEFNTGVGVFNITAGTGDEIKIDAKNIDIDCYDFKTSGDTFRIDYKEYKWYEWYKHVNFFSWSDFNSEINIIVPQKVYDKFVLKNGVGEYNINNIECKDADFDLGVGQSKFVDFISTGKADIDSGVGEVAFENCSINLSDFDCGVGEIDYSGKITGDSDINCGVGEFTMTIDGVRDDYDIDKDTGVGSIEIDNGSDSVRENSGSKIKIDIDGGVGDVRINFR